MHANVIGHIQTAMISFVVVRTVTSVSCSCQTNNNNNIFLPNLGFQSTASIRPFDLFCLGVARHTTFRHVG